MKYEVELTYPMTVEFESDAQSTVAIMTDAREEAIRQIAEMDHFDKVNWVPKVVRIKEVA